MTTRSRSTALAYTQLSEPTCAANEQQQLPAGNGGGPADYMAVHLVEAMDVSRSRVRVDVTAIVGNDWVGCR